MKIFIDIDNTILNTIGNDYKNSTPNIKNINIHDIKIFTNTISVTIDDQNKTKEIYLPFEFMESNISC